MKKLIAVGITIVCLASFALAQEAGPAKAEEKEINFDKIVKVLGDAWFGYNAPGSEKKVGWAHLSTKKGKYKGTDVFVLRDDIVGKLLNSELHFEAYCKPDMHLTPLFMKFTLLFAGATIAGEIQFDKNITIKTTKWENLDGVVPAGQQEFMKKMYNKEMPKPDNLILDFAFSRLVFLKSFKTEALKGKEYSVFVFPEMNPIKKRQITSTKKKTEIEGEEVEVEVIGSLTVDENRILRIVYASLGTLVPVKDEAAAKKGFEAGQPQEPFFQPVKGRFWEYEVTGGGNEKAKSRLEVTEVADDGSFTVKSSGEKMSGDSETVKWRLRKVYLTWELGPEVEWKVLKFGAKKGETWKSEFAPPGADPSAPKMVIGSEVTAIEDVKTPAGEFKGCIKATSTSKGPDGAVLMKFDLWWAKGVGLVKSTVKYGDGPEKTWVLKSYKLNPGKEEK